MIGASMTGLGLFQSLTRGHRVQEATQHALEAEAATLVEAIREAAPEDAGNLRDSVRQEPGDNPLSVRVIAGGTPATTKTSAAGTFDEGLMQEYGTSKRPAQPFFYPTIERMRDKIKADIDVVMDDAVKEES